MDEDYDACDLENWFLAIQSADGQVIIPSFHRPGIIRYDPKNGVNDWARTNPAGNWADSAARILRPVAADGHDPATFPDLVPDPATGKITFDVDNDADGVTDSVWLDLGYPARPDRVAGSPSRSSPSWSSASTAGSRSTRPATWPPGTPRAPTHAAHLGNSVSEIDPTYALQNADQDPRLTPILSLSPASACLLTRATPRWTSGGRRPADPAPQLLAGTRPQPNPRSPAPTGDPEDDQRRRQLRLRCLAHKGAGNPISCPTASRTRRCPISTNPLRSSGPTRRPGAMGRAPWIPGQPVPPRASGTELGGEHLQQPSPSRLLFRHRRPAQRRARAAADDNYNQFDPFPIGHTGEVNDRDFFDSAGGLMLPVDRMRRFVTPVDIDGSGRACMGRPLARGRRRGRRLRAGRLRRLLPPPRRPGAHQRRHPTAGRHRARSSIPRP